MTQAPQEPPAGPPPSGSESSRKLWIYLAVGTGVIILAVVLFIALRPNDSEPAANTTSEARTTTEQTTSEETTTDETSTDETTTTTPSNRPQRVSVDYQNGEVVGGGVQADIQEGSQVLLVVRADVSDEVHVHGYDLSTNVTPEQPARITFRADVPGEFDVELEELSAPLAVLTVNP
jgi:cytoskeletal protein RodZ